MRQVFTNASLLLPDGAGPRDIVVEGDRIEAVLPAGQAPRDGATDLNGAIVSPPLCDLQVNGGGGLMLGDCQNLDDLRKLAQAHAADGVPHILPTLISDSCEEITRVSALVEEGLEAGITNLLGLHLEGPHIARAGAHDPAMLRPLDEADLRLYLDIKSRVGCLKITLAPEVVAPATITALASAGIVVALGHSTCDYATACAAFDAGAATATHLFNAMSGLDHRAPGLALAALEHGTFGLIADGVHVHQSMLRLAARHGRVAYLVTDAMAVAGITDTRFTLSGRTITRKDGKLTLDDGTLAGADLTLARAVDIMAKASGLNRADCIAMATLTPRALIGLPTQLTRGAAAMFHIWREGHGPELVQGAVST